MQHLRLCAAPGAPAVQRLVQLLAGNRLRGVALVLHCKAAHAAAWECKRGVEAGAAVYKVGRLSGAQHGLVAAAVLPSPHLCWRPLPPSCAPHLRHRGRGAQHQQVADLSCSCLAPRCPGACCLQVRQPITSGDAVAAPAVLLSQDALQDSTCAGGMRSRGARVTSCHAAAAELQGAPLAVREGHAGAKSHPLSSKLSGPYFSQGTSPRPPPWWKYRCASSKGISSASRGRMLVYLRPRVARSRGGS